MNYSKQQRWRRFWECWRQSPAPDLAPAPAIKKQLEDTVAAVKNLAADAPFGGVSGFWSAVKMVHLMGIRSSVLGLQLVAHASGKASTDKMAMYFPRSPDVDKTDNTLSQALVGRLPWLAPQYGKRS